MKTQISNTRLSLARSLLATTIAFTVAGSLAAHAADGAQKMFASPEAAAKALAAAARADDEAALTEILGSSWKDVLGSGDAAADKAALDAFVAKYDQMNRWTTMTDGTRVLYIGADNYPYPVPLARDGASAWHFDSATGEREVRMRRIGANELLAIDAVNVIANAEEAYLGGKRDGQTATYASAIVSSDGKHDGLYWAVAQSESPSPLAALGDLTAQSALAEPLILDGYRYRILDAQGDTASGGAKSYIENGVMSGGFAVLASPVDYGKSGIMSFMLSREGVVYQKDLGEETVNIAAAIEAYEPGDGWTSVE